MKAIEQEREEMRDRKDERGEKEIVKKRESERDRKGERV